MNPDFNCCNSFALSSLTKVTPGTSSFVLVIEIVVFWFSAALDTTQFSGQVRMRSISELINSISRFFQKLPKNFNGTIISTFCGKLFCVESVFCLNLNEVLLEGKLERVPSSFKAGLSL